jgi:indolepyruvate ferredoxin oxidoreductase
LRKNKGSGEADFSTLPMPTLPALDEPYNILVTGIGGTGVVTIGALLGMAAHLEHKGASVLDQTGLAQKGGAVTTHVRIAKEPRDIHAVRIAAGEADLVLGADMVVVNDYWALSKIRAGRAKVVLNTYEAMPGTFTRNPDLEFPAAQIVEAVRQGSGGTPPEMIEATDLATALLGDSIATNLFMLGYAWQKGLVPVTMEAIERAIELNGAAVQMNLKAFGWGRYAAHDVDFVRRAAGLKKDPKAIDATVLDDRAISRTLDEIIARRVAFLTDYQDAAYARRYADLVAKVRAAEAAKIPGSTKLSEAVARYAFKLMAYKDEYEVARLYSQPAFWDEIARTFDGDYKVHFNLAPPLLAKKDAEGHLTKAEYGPWIRHAFRLLAKLRFLRGGALDVFGRTEERRMERQWIADYFAAVEELASGLTRDNLALAAEIASVPEHIRGYGHVKERHEKAARAQWNSLLARFRQPEAPRRAA